MAVMPSNGASGLCLAAQNGHLDVVRAMCGAGGEALLRQADNKNVTALVSAVRYKHTAIVRHMVQLCYEQLFVCEVKNHSIHVIPCFCHALSAW